MAAVEFGIIFDVSRLIARISAATPTGIDRVEFRYAAKLCERADVLFVRQVRDSIEVVSNSSVERIIKYLDARWTRNQKLTADLKAPTLLAVPDRGSRNLPNSVTQFIKRNCKTYYVNVSHLGMNRHDLLAELVFKWGVQLVFYVHDILPIQFPEYVKDNDADTHAKRLETALNLDSILLTNSRTTASDIAHWALSNRGMRVDPEVLYIGVEEQFSSESSADEGFSAASPFFCSGDPSPYFVALGTIEPRKNHLLLLELWRAFASSGQQNIPHLFIVGKRGWENGNVFAFLDRCQSIKSLVHEVSNVDDGKLRALIRSARAVLFPSFGEGWGMPLVEAMAMGVPVICSDLPVFKEASQGRALALGPLDREAWRRAILQYSVLDGTERQQLVEKTKSFNAPTWDAHFTKFFEILGSHKQNSRRVIPKLSVGRLSLPRNPEFKLSDGDNWIERFRPKSAQYFLQQADVFRDSGEFDSAATMYGRFLQQHPDNGPVWVQFGHMLKQVGDLQMAYDAYSEALRYMPGDVDLHIQFGHLFKVAARPQDANRYYRLALILDATCEASQHIAD